MPKKSPLWDYAIIVGNPKGNKGRCVFCGYRFFGVGRLRYHLAGVDGGGAIVCPNPGEAARAAATAELDRLGGDPGRGGGPYWAAGGPYWAGGGPYGAGGVAGSGAVAGPSGAVAGPSGAVAGYQQVHSHREYVVLDEGVRFEDAYQPMMDELNQTQFAQQSVRPPRDTVQRSVIERLNAIEASNQEIRRDNRIIQHKLDAIIRHFGCPYTPLPPSPRNDS